MDNGLDITRVGYKSGYCIFVFDTSPTIMESLKNGKEMKLSE